MACVLPVTAETIRLFLHILAATIWVGGQLTLAGLLPVLRAIGHDAPRLAARRFNLLAWSAFVVLIGTGIWNIAAVGDAGPAYRRTLTVKLVLVAVSGLTAFLHTRARSTAGLAVFGSLTGISALAALFAGVWLAAAV